jgi:DNA-binding CsgD family transcriptional regulator/Tfp pilus assembly protein PilF
MIGEICRRLDGLPLAIELAAARTNILSPEALLARLSNRFQILQGERQGVPDRLRTMRHAIDWSYELLAPPEQWLFRRMSVFAGGFSLDAAEAMCRSTDDGRDAWSALSALVDHSLVQAYSQPTGESRFLMLETIREYGLDQLDARGEEPDARLDHATWCMTLTEEAEPRIMGGDQEEWLARLDPEWDNIRAASDWSLAHGREQIALRILGAAWRFCSVRGHTTESRGFLDRALAATSGDRSAHRSRALVAAGNLAQDQRDLDIAQELLEQARELAVAIDHPPDVIQALSGLAKVAVNRSDYATAIDFHQRAAKLARDTGDQRAVGIALGGLAYVSYFQGKLDDAVRYWEEARQIVAALGDNLLESVAASNLGAVAKERGEYDRAENLLSRAVELQRRMQAFDSLPYTLTNLAETWSHLGDQTLAEDLLAEATSRFRDLGYKGSEGTCLTSYAQLAFDRGDIQRAAMMLIESTRLIHEAGEQFPITENADVLSEICAGRGDYGPAIELMAASATIRYDLGSEPKPVQLARIEELGQTIRLRVSEADYERHWQAGSGLGLDSLVRRITIVAREIVGAQLPQPHLPEPAYPEAWHNLTNREREILHQLTLGRSTQEISDTLFISPRTTTTHINNIFGKLEVSSRAAAVAYAMRNGLA